jgi:hypothetical protein
LEVKFTAPDGSEQSVFAFWDGGKTWRARFSPDQVGEWRYRTICSKDDNAGLHDRRGGMICVPYSGDHPLYRRGEIRLSGNRRYFTHADGAQFFMLADTVWNGPLLADEDSWNRFLADRVEKGFNAIQFVTTQWRAADVDANGKVAFTGNILIQIRPQFFQRLDRYFDAINEHGMIAVPVLLWAVAGNDNPGYALPEDQKIELARYLIARYGAHQVIWILAGDGKYLGKETESWKRIGRAVFNGNHRRLATMHPSHYEWVGEAFRSEPWYSFVSYQSGHGDSEERIRWLTEGPPRREWTNDPPLPVINQEPNYEDIVAYESKTPFDAHAVRRAAYWSLLIAPPAGITYGAHGVWGWHLKEGPVRKHDGAGIGKPWQEAMRLPGSMHMYYLKQFFESIEWWSLRPAPELIINQPGKSDPAKFIAAAKSESGNLCVFYIPTGGTVEVNTNDLNFPLNVEWFDPCNGERISLGTLTEPQPKFTQDTKTDCILLFKK